MAKITIKTRAIVLQSIKYGDSSLVVKMFTEEEGLQSFMVKGVFGKKKYLSPLDALINFFKRFIFSLLLLLTYFLYSPNSFNGLALAIRILSAARPVDSPFFLNLSTKSHEGVRTTKTASVSFSFKISPFSTSCKSFIGYM